MQAMRISFLLLVGMALAACGGGGGGGGAPPAALATRFPIDGVVDFGVFTRVEQQNVSLRDTLGTGAVSSVERVRWAIANDDRDLYVAVEWTDATHDNTFDRTQGPLDFDGVKLLIDTDGDGVHETDEDSRTVIAASAGSTYVDQHVSSGDETDQTADGFARLRYDSSRGVYQAEFLFPGTEDVHGEDGNLTALSRYNLLLFEHVELLASTGNVGGVFGMDSSSVNWPTLPVRGTVAHARPRLPTDLGGLIVFISTHEEPKGDIYTFDPATGVVTRVTQDPSRFKEACSLSHDRTRIAFHAAPTQPDFTSYEIYVVDVDGGNLTQLTSNSALDGHPAWSPDDSRIAYATFRVSPSAIILMQSDGTEIANLTPPGVADNDPEFLPDGRIVFKTDRFVAQPNVTIAVMDDTGSHVVDLGDSLGGSDHDPTGDTTHAVFERFLKGTDYTTDVDSGLTAWDIIEARLDGSGQATLFADGWVNWLPLIEPGRGDFVLYLKSSGHTAAHLMTRAGEEIGRLIPDITRISYIDWK